MLGMFRPSGGLRYHLRSKRYGKLWRPFRTEISEWLEEWDCGFEELILLGPSGAYTLPTAWLKKFKKIHAYELDPFAPLMFRLNHAGVNVTFHRRNLFWVDGKLSTMPLKEILAEHPLSPVLFSNILGQVLLEGQASEEEWHAFLERMRLTLNFKRWASYHDLFTHEEGCIIDHLMQGKWTEGLPTRQFVWQLTPNSRHIIEGVSV